MNYYHKHKLLFCYFTVIAFCALGIFTLGEPTALAQAEVVQVSPTPRALTDVRTADPDIGVGDQPEPPDLGYLPPGFEQGEKTGWGDEPIPPGWGEGDKTGWNDGVKPPGLQNKDVVSDPLDRPDLDNAPRVSDDVTKLTDIAGRRPKQSLGRTASDKGIRQKLTDVKRPAPKFGDHAGGAPKLKQATTARAPKFAQHGTGGAVKSAPKFAQRGGGSAPKFAQRGGSSAPKFASGGSSARTPGFARKGGSGPTFAARGGGGSAKGGAHHGRGKK